MSSQKRSFLTGAFVLSLASLVTKMLSALYKVPFQNLTGDQGFYVYQQVYPIYGIAVSLALNGFPLFVSKIASESETKNQRNENLLQLFSWISLLSVTVFLVLNLFSGQIASLMGDMQLSSIIQSVSYIFLLIPFLSIFRGYFQGSLNMVPTGVSQLGEQIVRVSILLSVAFLFTHSNWDVYEMGTRAMHSSWISFLTGVIILLLFLFKENSIKEFIPTKPSIFSREIGKRLFREGFAIAMISSLMVLFQFIDSFTVYNGLTNKGMPDQLAMSLKGVYDRGQPFVQLGLVAGISFATSLLPVMRKYFQQKNFNEWKKNAVSALRLTLVFSSAASIGLISIMPWINHALFGDFRGISVLSIYMISVVFASMIICCQSVIESTNVKTITFLSLVIGLGFKLGLNEFIVERLGLIGSSTVTVMSLCIIFVMLSVQIPVAVWKSLARNHFIIKWLTNLGILFTIVYGGLNVLNNVMIDDPTRLSSLVLALVGMSVGLVVYVFFCLKMNLLTSREINQLPFSKHLQKVGK